MTDVRLPLMWHSIKEFASSEWQERIWLRGEGPEVSSFEEAMYRLFDDAEIDDLLSRHVLFVEVSENQFKAIGLLRDELNRFDLLIPDQSPPSLILNHPEWPAVRQAAQNALLMQT